MLLLVLLLVLLLLRLEQLPYVVLAQEWLQLFAWTEQELPACLDARAALLKDSRATAASEEQYPMFCLETSIKLLYWSGLAYTKVRGSPPWLATRGMSCATGA